MCYAPFLFHKRKLDCFLGPFIYLVCTTFVFFHSFSFFLFLFVYFTVSYPKIPKKEKMTSSSNTTKEQRPITPPATPISHAYPSPTSSSSKNTSPSTSSSQRPNLKPSFSTKSTSIRENVQVMVRCRPRSQKELEVDEEPCWLIRPEEGTIELARLKTPNSISTFQYGNKKLYCVQCVS